jgi:hypothetical protein
VALSGFASGIVGFLFGTWAFLYVGMFTGGADQLSTASARLSPKRGKRWNDS